MSLRNKLNKIPREKQFKINQGKYIPKPIIQMKNYSNNNQKIEQKWNRNNIYIGERINYMKLRA